MYFPFIENLFFCFYFKKFTLKNSAGRYECDTALLHFLLAVWGSIKMSPWKTNKTTLYPMIRADNTSIWWIRVNCYPSSRDILSPLWWYLLPDSTNWASSRQSGINRSESPSYIMLQYWGKCIFDSGYYNKK